MSKEYLLAFFDEFDYPADARDELFRCFFLLEQSPLKAELARCVSSYAKDINYSYAAMIRCAKQTFGQIGVHEYTGILLLVILLSEPLKAHYSSRNIDTAIWKNSMYDLKYKMLECHEVYGIWGTSSTDWFAGFFKMTRFGFGNLQFEIIKFGQHSVVDGVTLSPDSSVINVHIPRTGMPLDHTGVLASYRAAKQHFSSLFDGRAVFRCKSWLLFEKHKEILSPGSNLYQFISDFTIVDAGHYPDYAETWRLFDTKDISDPDKLPQNTSLRRAYVELMKKGEKTGWGLGVFVL